MCESLKARGSRVTWKTKGSFVAIAWKRGTWIEDKAELGEQELD